MHKNVLPSVYRNMGHDYIQMCIHRTTHVNRFSGKKGYLSAFTAVQVGLNQCEESPCGLGNRSAKIQNLNVVLFLFNTKHLLFFSLYQDIWELIEICFYAP